MQFYKNKQDNEAIMINLIDTPGYFDFSHEVSSALRISDSCILLVDVIEGITPQTEILLRLLCIEKNRPIIVLNKLDELFDHLKNNYELIFQTLLQIINKANSIIELYNYQVNEDFIFDPSKGNVIFASCLQQWGFTLQSYSQNLKQIIKLDDHTIIQNLWGDIYYNQSLQQFTDKQFINNKGQKSLRSFIQYVLIPLHKFQIASENTRQDELIQFTEKLQLQNLFPLSKLNNIKHLNKKDRAAFMLNVWLPLTPIIFISIQKCLPSPIDAMKYRSQYLYENNDECGLAIRQCDKEGPLMVQVTQMISSEDFSVFYSIGRVFSGTITQGQQVRIQNDTYQQGEKEGMIIKTIDELFLIDGQQLYPVGQVEAGGLVVIKSVDEAFNKLATFTNSSQANNIIDLKLLIKPVSKLLIQPIRVKDLQICREGLKLLKKYDSLVEVLVENTGSYILSCGGEEHQRVCLDFLNKVTNNSIKIIAKTVEYRESVGQVSSQICLSKSPNKQNRLYGTCQPLSEELSQAIVNGQFQIDSLQKDLTQELLQQEYNWDIIDSRNIWCFGPSDSFSTNCIVNQTNGNYNLKMINDSLLTAFHQTLKEGLLCEEYLHNVRFNITDASINSDPQIHRSNQIIPTAKKLFKACQYVSDPLLLEPVYTYNINIHKDTSVLQMYHFLQGKRGVIFEQDEDCNSQNIQFHIPISECGGLDAEIKSITQVQSINVYSQNKWQPIQGTPFDYQSHTAQIIQEIRKIKGINPFIPELDIYLDKL